MMSRLGHYSNNMYSNLNIMNSELLCIDREYGDIDRYVQRRLHASGAYIDRLEQEAVLKGHEGCVNCLEWSSDGRILASGSDDCQVILWDAFRARPITQIRTKHGGNMFSVKFLPRHNNALLATGAADKYIYVFDVNRPSESLLSCHCHRARVKRLATAPDSPSVFWSAGEDGIILQLDIREPHVCNTTENHVKLINLFALSSEAKCLAINPMRTELLAVGANDPYARVYDRRMLHPVSSYIGFCEPNIITSSFNSPILPDCVTYYCPGHISKNNTMSAEHESRAITYLTFNAAGTELLVNMGSEHIYLYDLLNAEQPVFLSLPEYTPPAPADVEMVSFAEDDGCASATIPSQSSSSSSSRRKLPKNIEALKKMGNDFLENEKYLRAIAQYSDAIAVAPNQSVLYLNRAVALMRRGWFGDVYAALRDCQKALRLDPSYVKAHFRLARALRELGLPNAAEDCLKELINRFPNYANNHGVLMLHKDIKESRHSKDSQPMNEGLNQELPCEEFRCRDKAKDYCQRFVGHCNTTTDIKEVNYFGHDGDFIVAGSDDGNFFIWERKTCKIRAIYRADSAIVNCVQPHPSICLMATSGIDHEIKIWSPIAESAENRPHLVTYLEKCVEDNQQKMKTDPFDLSTRNAFCFNN